ncbi:hypothetical protein QBC45DRAFT_22323 [Copromyces sp. CBS 386.78]|nr:hypothetical protein QBC45DRAFT_22323 [Copromyces sp. CBS 386.78]
MTDQDASPSSNLRPRRATKQPDLLVPHRHDHAPTAISGQDHQVTTNNLPDVSVTSSNFNDDNDDNCDDAIIPPHQRLPSKGALRPHKHRTNGAFLLSDPVFGAHPPNTQLQLPKRQSLLEPSRNRITKHGLDRSPGRNKRTGPSNEVGLGLVQRSGSTAEPSVRQAPSFNGSAVTSNRGSLAGETVIGATPSPRTSMAPLDMESAQIVNMALNLSESRRIASRRIISQPVPPRLGPVPENSTGGSLRQHLQQQRRVSRNMSPRPDHSPRLASARSLQAPADLEPYQYHFSQSTLGRAQKAREYLGLMAQYRRILELLPPLKADRSRTSSTISPPLTPNGSNFPSRVPTNDTETIIGRHYNPLQYIRNRKIRARERKALDGEGQGFNDVERVSEWVDEVAKWIAKGQDRVPGNPSIPPFSPARILSQENSPQSLGSRPTTAMPKLKRPRVDWAVDPADMIADIYWLEQDDNKFLLEDRNWKRLFPQGGAEIYRSLSRDDTPGSSKIFSNSNSLTALDKARTEQPPQVVEQKPTQKAHHEQPYGFSASRARDKAQQKLRALKGSHHRANSTIYNRDILRIHRGSFSESSDTDSDRKRRGRHGTISSSGKDILARQMEDMIAQEQRDIEAHPLYDQETQRLKLPYAGVGISEKDWERARITPTPNRADNVDGRRPASRSEPADLEGSYFKLQAKPAPAQVLAGRTGVGSLNGDRRFSTDYDTSPPYSPDLRPMHDVLVPGLGMDVSPRSTRPSSPIASSPSRNPLTKVRSIFRDLSSERLAELPSHVGKEENTESVQFLSDRQPVESPGTLGPGTGMLSRRASRSPLRKTVTKGTDSSQKSSKSTGNHKLREDGSSSLKGLFRGQRIDSFLRSGVSKVSDMFWRKETVPGPVDEYSSSDESDAESRGRSRSLPSSQPRKVGHSPSNHGKANGEKSYLDVMPQFIPTAEKHHSKSKSVGGSIEQQTGLLSASPPSRPLSRQSSRFELLKPPKIDVQNASPTSSPGLRPLEIARSHPWGNSDVSDVEGSRKSSVNTDVGGVRDADARLNAMLSMAKDRQLSNASSAGRWSIADREENATPVPPQTIVSKREIARLRALLLSSGIHAMEIDRRAKARKLLNTSSIKPEGENATTTTEPKHSRLSWPDIVALSPDPSTHHHLLAQPVAQTDVFPLAANILSTSIQNSATAFQSSVAVFQTQTAPRMTNRVEALRARLNGELTEMTRRAAEEADDAGGDLMTHQRLKVKRVVDVIDRIVRRRRRRFRWVRRAGWLAVEWVLVGFMWYVWFVVMIARVFLGVGRGVVGVGRWLLWL